MRLPRWHAPPLLAPAAFQADTGEAAAAGALIWRTPLAASRPHWEGWYRGLSDTFLSLPVPKMLLLAGTDRLDKSLTIGQMQGKFQLVLMPAAGHAIQEDEPVKTAEHLQQFLHRFRIGEPPMVIPRAPPGVRAVLPLAAGPLFRHRQHCRSCVTSSSSSCCRGGVPAASRDAPSTSTQQR
ncbi:hypothetical protein COO60DRAFT_476829 [Scenedesmus sp. NREL 46B-D3]|nr:hypothetical protein COO60DRAFT_476829 [Scenedesmus sp. NREL 46B-D3]